MNIYENLRELFKVRKRSIDIKLRTSSLMKEFENTSIIYVPSNTYIDSVNTVNSLLYKVYFDGEEINDVYGIIRMSPQNKGVTIGGSTMTFDGDYTTGKTKRRKVLNWQEEFGD